MNETEKIKKLRFFSLFKDLSDTELSSIAKFIHEQSIPAKKNFIAQDTESNTVYFIYKGLVRAYRSTNEGQDVNLSVMGEGEIIGEMGILEELPRSANVETIQDTIVFTLTKADFINLLKTYPKTSITLLKFLSRRLRNITDKVEGVMSKSMEKRTVDALSILSKLFPKSEILLSHEELATIIGATRARVTEVLDMLESEGKIKLSHRKIKLL